ncbi:Protein of unknown function [Capnocytophaga haemolytica]|jgi:hypothetical protein|uniref:Protein of uncharacterized function (DUF3098) n=1 Tax=Capnocytophaga haemolytica TaxID=45243 RepID=A0AAX2GYE4_9FLAO|nr:DUF3098 domain-containing protein [Capnocytophaga haemolytica]AMD84919.1 hypothetical protein AXF12_04935 [Capnocytophaga haemolytica]SFN78261.1 Protein of unknown function [Capnocytophaga haemolytica]SNV06424.1 Protein of uncharacterised function (DUF3098) [Capnocytophaga haemolytica]
MKKHHSTLLFEKENYIVMCIGLAVIAIGFILMSGGGSDDPNMFDPSIFNFRRIHLAPAIVLLGFAIEVYAILFHSKKVEKE